MAKVCRLRKETAGSLTCVAWVRRSCGIMLAYCRYRFAATSLRENDVMMCVVLDRLEALLGTNNLGLGLC